MISRRSILSALGAAPVIGPEMLKAAASLAPADLDMMPVSPVYSEHILVSKEGISHNDWQRVQDVRNMFELRATARYAANRAPHPAVASFKSWSARARYDASREHYERELAVQLRLQSREGETLISRLIGAAS